MDGDRNEIINRNCVDEQSLSESIALDGSIVLDAASDGGELLLVADHHGGELLLEDAEGLAEEAARIYKEYRMARPKEESPSAKKLIEYLETTRGPIVLQSRDYRHEDNYYFLPVRTADDVQLLDLATPPGRMNLVPVKPNPRRLPQLAILHSAYTKSLDDLLHAAGSKDPPTQDSAAASTLFRVDTVGQQSTPSVNYDQVPPNGPLKYVAPPDDIAPPVENRDRIRSMEDLRKVAKSLAGTSLRQKCKKTQILTSLADHDRLKPMTLDDKKVKKKEKAAREANELDGWYGMKRQNITDAHRLEFKALELRGFLNPRKHYRGSKRSFALANAQSGFYQFGTVVGGGLADGGKIGIDTKFLPTKKRKTKSLINF